MQVLQVGFLLQVDDREERSCILLGSLGVVQSSS